MSKLTDCLSATNGLALALCWDQWRSLSGERVPTHHSSCALIDPEALVLSSLAMRTKERRLDDMLLRMADDSALLSVQRLKTMAHAFPAHLATDLAWFANAARQAGDARWRSLTSLQASASRGRPGKSMPPMSLRVASAFMFRMRSGLGVGIKADLVACLAAMRSATNQHAGGLTVAELSEVLGYSKNATRQALDEMVRADVVLRIDGRPSQHSLGNIFFQSPDRRASVPSAAQAPPWLYFSQVFAILIVCEQLLADPEVHDLPEVVQASRLRDIAERFSAYWSWFGAAPVDAQLFPGVRFFDGFAPVIGAMVDLARKLI